MAPAKKSRVKKNKIVSHSIGNVQVSYTPESRRALLQHAKEVRAALKAKGSKARYSVLRDLVSPSKSNRVTKGSAPSWVGKSQGVSSVKGAKIRGGATKLYDPTYGQLRARYFTKSLKGGEPREIFVKEMRDPKALPIKRREAKDAIKAKKLTGIKTPKFIFSLEVPLKKGSRKRRFITATRKLKNVQSIDKLLAGNLPANKKKQLIGEVRRICTTLAREGMLPSILRAGHFLVSGMQPRRLYLTDTGAGFTPITRNRLVLLEELEANSQLPRPEWDKIHRSHRAFKAYWNSLSEKTRQRVLKRKIDRLVEEIQIVPDRRKGITPMRKRVRELIVKLFPASKIAQEIKAGKFIS